MFHLKMLLKECKLCKNYVLVSATNSFISNFHDLNNKYPQQFFYIDYKVNELIILFPNLKLFNENE